MDRLVCGLAPQVPQRDVEPGVAAHLGAGAGEADVADQVLRMEVDAQGVGAQEQRRRKAVDVGLGRGHPVEDLAEPGEALVGVDVDPEDVGVLLDADGLDGGDLHGAPRGQAGAGSSGPGLALRRRRAGVARRPGAGPRLALAPHQVPAQRRGQTRLAERRLAPGLFGEVGAFVAAGHAIGAGLGTAQSWALGGASSREACLASRPYAMVRSWGRRSSGVEHALGRLPAAGETRRMSPLKFGEAFRFGRW